MLRAAMLRMFRRLTTLRIVGVQRVLGGRNGEPENCRAWWASGL